MNTIINMSIKLAAPSPGVGKGPGTCPKFEGSVTSNELSRFIGFQLFLFVPGQ